MWLLDTSKLIMKIYIARPMAGHTYEELAQNYQETADMLRGMGYEVYHAMCGKSYLKNDTCFKAVGYDEYPLSNNHAIMERDHWMCQTADVLFVNLLGCKRVSIGTCFELAWAHHMGKHTVVCMEKDNLHRHAFVIEAADVLYETFNEGMDYLAKLARNEI